MNNQIIVRSVAVLAIIAGISGIALVVAQPGLAANNGNGSMNGPGDPEPLPCLK